MPAAIMIVTAPAMRRRPLDPRTAVQFLPGVGPARARHFERLGVHDLGQLVRHYPREYLDARRFVKLADLEPGQLVTVSGTVKSAVALRTRSGRGDFSLTLGDGTGTVGCYFFGRPFLARMLRPGTRVVMSGELDPDDGRMMNPAFEVFEDDLERLLDVGRMVPVHALTKGLTARQMRRAVRGALDAVAHAIPDAVPAALAAARGLMPLAEALEQIHFPADEPSLAGARRRLVFEELLLLQTVLELRRLSLGEASRAGVHARGGELARRATAALPWALTPDQRTALAEIAADLAKPVPMQRLLLGDVGSGKTVVAFLAALRVLETGRPVAFMVPTEVLARQHAATLRALAAPVDVPVALLTAATPAAERREVTARLGAGEALLVIGTQALLEAKIAIPDLGLAIVDEQHRFGVRQRARLAGKSVVPDLLVLTATPIPRTLALAYYGDLEISRLRSRPAGRGRRVTRVTGEEKFPQVIEFLSRELAQGRQAFVVLPSIEEGARAAGRAAEAEFERLKQHPLLRGRRIELLHGRLAAEPRHAIMAAFVAGAVDVLVATTVIEVGIDVPNATLMVVESADRFGLTQLHQLRGRIGRGAHRSVCVLVASPEAGARARERLAVLARLDDGFAIAEEDLRLRGPGEPWSTRQSGLPRLKLADLARDQELLTEARAAARELLGRDPQLMDPRSGVLRTTLLDQYREALEMALSG
jgi:ATP-dependent DNA helicase RecG